MVVRPGTTGDGGSRLAGKEERLCVCVSESEEDVHARVQAVKGDTGTEETGWRSPSACERLSRGDEGQERLA